MKKTFRFLALSLMMLGGTMISWAASVSVKPADGTFVGQTVSGGVVKYQVVAGTAIDYKATNAQGDEVDVTAYPVEISGLDYDGLTAKNLTKLNIATSFTEKYGEALNGYYVIRIVDTQGTNATQPDYKKAFYAMTQLEELTFAADANGLKDDKFTFSVGNYSFYGCTALKKLVFPDNVDKIGKYAFQGTIITDFTIPAKCATIGACAFNDTKKLGTVTVSENGNAVLTTIDKQVFANSFVSTLDLSKATALQSINDQAFIYNVSDVNAQLKTIKLPDVAPAENKFASLGTNGTCFANCMALESIGNLEKSIVKDINPGAFENCAKLTELNFPATASINTDGKTSPFLNSGVKKITFAAGWAGTIKGGVYVSTDGKKIKYNTSTKKYELEAYSLTAADQLAELSQLEEIEFKGVIKDGGTIKASAFENCIGLETLTFGGFEISATAPKPIVIEADAFKNTSIKALDFKNTLISQAENLSIMGGAFTDCAALAKVTFGTTTFNKDGGTFYIYDGAFSTGNEALTEVVFGDIINSDATPAGYNGTFYIGYDASILSALTYGDYPAITFGDGEHLQKVTFGNVEGGLGISQLAFASTGLTNVKFGNIKAPFAYATASGVVIAKDAFAGGAESGKKVEFGNISDNSIATKLDNGKLGFAILNGAFAAESLTEVKFGDITCSTFTIEGKKTVGPGAFQSKSLKSVEIGLMEASHYNTTGSAFVVEEEAFQGGEVENKTVQIGNIQDYVDGTTHYNLSGSFQQSAFAADLLATVKIGDISATTLNIATTAFANTNTVDAMDETVEIGKFASAGLTIANNAFQGPQVPGSDFTVTIGDLAKDATLAAGAFTGPAVGTTSYTLGNIDATANIPAGAFVGSKDIEGNTATSVEIGDYNKVFKNGTFTNVNDVTTADWNVASLMLKFDGIRELTVDGDVTKALNGGDLNTLEEITITGNVSANIGENTGGFGKAVRRINFTSDDPEIIAGAVKTGSFEKASDDALAKGETVSVIYRVKTAKKSNAIFEKKAFNDVDDGKKNVVLYTDQWSLEHTFQNVEIGGADEQVYRIMLSASSVAPGEDIEATCVKGANGKYSYGRLYVPAGTGMRYKVSAEYDDATKKNGVNLFSATISGTDIYMNTVTVMDGYYWIDANETAQTLIVRTSDVSADKVIVEAEYVSEEEAQAMDAEGSVILATDWFDLASAKKNALKYATSAITPAEFQNDASTYNKGIYVMANPAKNNLAFAKYNQTDTSTKDLAKGSVYVVTRANQYARLNVIWPEDIDEESDATAIQNIENDSEANDAIYNLQGVRVKNAQKGLYIINGKKVIK